MSVVGKRNQLAEIIKKIKNDKVRSTHDPEAVATNIHNVVHGWRGDELVIAMFPAALIIDTALGAARSAAIGFGCDTLALTAETYTAEGPISPFTGKKWAPGEMQRTAEEDGALETGAVIESLVTIVVNRAGDTTGMSQRYRISRRVNGLNITSYDIEWLPEMGDDATFGGRVVDSLMDFMNEVPFDAYISRMGISPADFGLDAEQARTHTDCGVVKSLLSAGFDGSMMLLAPEGSVRAEIIEKSLGNLGRRM